MGLFDDQAVTPKSGSPSRLTNPTEELFDWLLKKAETDLGFVQAFVASHAERTNQISQLQDTFLREIRQLNSQILETRDTELNNITSELNTISERIVRIESTTPDLNTTKEFVATQLTEFTTQINEEHSRIANRHQIIESLGTQLTLKLKTLEEDINASLHQIHLAELSLRDIESTTQSLSNSVALAESANHDTHILAESNAKQIAATEKRLSEALAQIQLTITGARDRKQDHDALLTEFSQTIGPKLETLELKCQQEYSANITRDERLAELSSDIALLTQQLKRLESNTSTENRSLRELFEQWHAEIVPTITYLESQAAAQDKRAKEVLETVNLTLANHYNLIEANSNNLARTNEELAKAKTTFDKIDERVTQAEANANTTKATTDSLLYKVEQLATQLAEQHDTVRATLTEEQLRSRLFEQRLFDFQENIFPALEQLRGQSYVDTEIFKNWEQDFRKAFDSRLSAAESAITQQGREWEDNQSGVTVSNESLTNQLRDLHLRIEDHLSGEQHNHDSNSKHEPDLLLLHSRTSDLQSQFESLHKFLTQYLQESRATESAVREELMTLKSSLERSYNDRLDKDRQHIINTLDNKLEILKTHSTQTLGITGASNQELVNLVASFRSELDKINVVLKQKDIPSNNLDSKDSFNALLADRLQDHDRRLEERMELLEAGQVQQIQKINALVEGIKNDIAELRSCTTQKPIILTGDQASEIEAICNTQCQQFEQQVARALSHFEIRNTEIAANTEAALNEFRSTVASVEHKLTDQLDRAITSLTVTLEEKLNSRVQELWLRLSHERDNVGDPNAEAIIVGETVLPLANGDKQKDCLIHEPNRRDTVYGAREPTEIGLVTIQPLNSPDGGTQFQRKASLLNEKEQLKSLQERMSTEIERVRAELREKSGRWKVRRAAV